MSLASIQKSCLQLLKPCPGRPACLSVSLKSVVLIFSYNNAFCKYCVNKDVAYKAAVYWMINWCGYKLYFIRYFENGVEIMLNLVHIMHVVLTAVSFTTLILPM